MSIATPSIRRRGLVFVLIALMLLSSLLLPHAAQAQATCRLPARLHIGDAVEVIDGTANTLRTGPGLRYPPQSLRMAPGEVWYVLDGPVCADGIYWYQVAIHDFVAWTAEGQPGQGYYLGRVDRLSNLGGSTAVCTSQRLSVGMQVMVGDTERQHVRQAANKNAPHIAWLDPGVPVTIIDGPRCADGWIWWYIRDNSGRIQGWTSEGDGPSIPWLVPVGGSTAVCTSQRLSVGMQVMVGDTQRQHVRQAANKNAAHVAWLDPRVQVTIIDGPRCADGWIWWYIRDNSGRIQGWTSEGDGPTIPWLVPARGGGSGGSSGGGLTPTPDPKAVMVRPTFTGSLATSWTLTPTSYQAIFSPDQEALTVSFTDFVVRAPVGSSQARRVEMLTMPVRSGPRGYTATGGVLGRVDCSDGGRATLTLQLGSAVRTISCRDYNTSEVTLRVALPANADLDIVLTAQVWAPSGAQPSAIIDILDIGLTAR